MWGSVEGAMILIITLSKCDNLHDGFGAGKHGFIFRLDHLEAV